VERGNNSTPCLPSERNNEPRHFGVQQNFDDRFAPPSEFPFTSIGHVAEMFLRNSNRELLSIPHENLVYEYEFILKVSEVIIR